MQRVLPIDIRVLKKKKNSDLPQQVRIYSEKKIILQPYLRDENKALLIIISFISFQEDGFIISSKVETSFLSPVRGSLRNSAGEGVRQSAHLLVNLPLTPS